MVKILVTNTSLKHVIEGKIEGNFEEQEDEEEDISSC
jgi:hypothetical protein